MALNIIPHVSFVQHFGDVSADNGVLLGETSLYYTSCTNSGIFGKFHTLGYNAIKAYPAAVIDLDRLGHFEWFPPDSVNERMEVRINEDTVP